MKKRIVAFAAVQFLFLAPIVGAAQGPSGPFNSTCAGFPTAQQLAVVMNIADNNTVGGLFNGERMWAAMVNRDGELCVYATNTSDPRQAWPGSQAIAKAKAYTANAFSHDAGAATPPLNVFALSTARLYTLAQPDHSLFGLNNSNPFNPDFLAPPTGEGGGQGEITGGIITFGGGVPIYNDGQIVGGLGLSGDTACADHEMAKRVRTIFGLDPPGGSDVDDILYTQTDGPSPLNHPLCVNTFRDGTFIGNEQANVQAAPAAPKY